MSPQVGSNSSSLWNGSHGGPEKSSNAARLKNTFLEKLNEKYKNHGNKTTTQGRHMLEQSRCIICDHSRLSPGRHSCVFKKVCVLLGVWSPNNAALTSKGPMFPSILEVRGGQAGKEARTKKTQHLPPKKSFVLLSKTSKYIKCADAFTTEYLWTCSQPEDKEKFSSAASLLSFGLNVHWATGSLLKDSDPGLQLLMHLL